MGAKGSKGIKTMAILLIMSGVLGLLYRGFTYTQKTDEAKVGSLELTINEQHKIVIPVEASVGAIVIGAALLLILTKNVRAQIV